MAVYQHSCLDKNLHVPNAPSLQMIHGRNIEEKNKSYIKNFIKLKLCMSYTFKLLLWQVLCHIKSLCVLTEKLHKY